MSIFPDCELKITCHKLSHIEMSSVVSDALSQTVIFDNQEKQILISRFTPTIFSMKVIYDIRSFI